MKPQSDHESDSDSDSEGLSMFSEPKDFRPPTPPSSRAYYSMPSMESSSSSPSRDSSQSSSSCKITLNLIGSHPLWGHHLWNSSPILSDYLTRHSQSLVKGSKVLELGAAAALPSIVCAKLGSHTVVATDYPDHDLVGNMKRNLRENLEELEGQDGDQDEKGKEKGKGKGKGLIGMGYIWGNDESVLLDQLSFQGAASDDQEKEKGKGKGSPNHFDLILLSDLIFNHQAHPALLKTIDRCLPPPTSTSTSASTPTSSSNSDSQTPHHQESSSQQQPEFEKQTKTPCALVFFSHHRPHLAHKDMQFFHLARENGWKTEEIGRWKMPPMFPNDPGSEEVRGTVHGWSLSR